MLNGPQRRGERSSDGLVSAFGELALFPRVRRVGSAPESKPHLSGADALRMSIAAEEALCAERRVDGGAKTKGRPKAALISRSRRSDQRE